MLDELIELILDDARDHQALPAHRVRVAVSSMRKLGLSEHLLTSGDGYLLTTECPLFVDASETGV